MIVDQRQIDFRRTWSIAEQEKYEEFLKEHPRLDMYDDEQSMTVEEHAAYDKHMADFYAERRRKSAELTAELRAEGLL